MLLQLTIGHWGKWEDLVGTRFLKGDTASQEDVRAIMRGVGVKEYRAFESHSDAGSDPKP